MTERVNHPIARSLAEISGLNPEGQIDTYNVSLSRAWYIVEQETSGGSVEPYTGRNPELIEVVTASILMDLKVQLLPQ